MRLSCTVNSRTGSTPRVKSARSPLFRRGLHSQLADRINAAGKVCAQPAIPARLDERARCDPPVGGTFQFQTFILAPSLEIWRKTISGAEGGCWRGKWCGLFWATSLEKIFG